MSFMLTPLFRRFRALLRTSRGGLERPRRAHPRGGSLARVVAGWGGVGLGVSCSAGGAFESAPVAPSEVVPHAQPVAPAPRCPQTLPSPPWNPEQLDLPRESGFEAAVFETATDCGPLTRRYVIRVPAGDASSAPVLIVLHDAGQYAEHAPIPTRWWFEDVALRERAVLVYGNAGPVVSGGDQGLGNGGVWQTDETAHPAVDDFEYLRRIIDDLRGRRGLAQSGQVFLSGYGSGAVMALAAAARHPERYSGVAAFLPTRSLRPDDVGALPRRAAGERRLRSVFVVLPAVSAGGGEGPHGLARQWAAALGSEPAPVRSTRQEPGIERFDASLGASVALRVLRLSAQVDPFPLPGGGDPITRAASEARPFFFDGPGTAWAFFHGPRP